MVRYIWVRRLARSRPLPEALELIRAGAGTPRRLPAVTRNPWRLSLVVQRVLRRLPSDTRCLMQTMTLLAMLSSRGDGGVVVISTKNDGEFTAHAWLERNGRPLLPAELPEYRLAEL